MAKETRKKDSVPLKITYSSHLRLRIKERLFPADYPKKVYKSAKLKLFDTATKHNIAISKLEYAGKIRNIQISYDIIEKGIEIITIHPVSNKEIQRRLLIGRWKKQK